MLDFGGRRLYRQGRDRRQPVAFPGGCPSPRRTLWAAPRSAARATDHARRGRCAGARSARRSGRGLGRNRAWRAACAGYPRVGWSFDPQRLGTVLHLPRAGGCSEHGGVDRAQGPVVSQWTLLDLFPGAGGERRRVSPLELAMGLATLSCWSSPGRKTARPAGYAELIAAAALIRALGATRLGPCSSTTATCPGSPCSPSRCLLRSLRCAQACIRRWTCRAQYALSARARRWHSRADMYSTDENLLQRQRARDCRRSPSPGGTTPACPKARCRPRTLVLAQHIQICAHGRN